MNKYVPKKLRKYLPDGGFFYTDILAYPPTSLYAPPYQIMVKTIPPLLTSKVCIPLAVYSGVLDNYSCRALSVKGGSDCDLVIILMTR